MKARVILNTKIQVKAKYEGDKLIYCEHPLILRLVEGNNRKHFSLGVSLPASRWENGKYKDIPISRYMTRDEITAIKSENARVRDLITEIENKFGKKIRELTIEGRRVSVDTLHNMVEKPAKRDYMVLQWMEKLRDDFKKVDNIGQANIYDNARRLLSLFLNKNDITFEEIDLPFLHRYEHFLRQRKVKDSTISIYMRTLRAAIARAVKQNYAKAIPFAGYSIPKARPNKRALSIPEMEAVLNGEKVNKNTDYYRYMAFSYYTIGMNFTDMARLTWDNIRGNEIHYIRQKIHHKLIIPVHPKVRDILNYYRTITGKNPSIKGINDHYVFPVLIKEIHITEAMRENRIRKVLKEFNKELKVIGQAAKIDTPLTSYVLRHTAITNLVRSGITADAIQALAGHKRLTTTENYIKEASTEQKAKAVNSL